MAWRKLGIVYSPDNSRPWSRSHAALPSAVSLNDEIVRVFFSTRDSENRSIVSFVDLVLDPSPRVVNEAQAPVLVPPPPGHFDSDGVGLGSVVPSKEETRLYYMGWALHRTCPWRNALGVAAGDLNTGSFRRMFDGPVVPLTAEDPFTLSYPTVMKFGPDDWRMWYGSNLFWGATQHELEHHIKLKRSVDGIDWSRPGKVVLPLSQKGEYIVIKPSLIVKDGVYRMWFATRGDHYRIGAAISSDGENWTRCDETDGLDVSDTGWDSEMVCYPSVIDHQGRRYMFYNGNRYGLDGLGLAVWE